MRRGVLCAYVSDTTACTGCSTGKPPAPCVVNNRRGAQRVGWCVGSQNPTRQDGEAHQLFAAPQLSLCLVVVRGRDGGLRRVWRVVDERRIDV